MAEYRGQREAMETNRRRWDESVPLHVASDFYDVAAFRAGQSTLHALELGEVGDVGGKTLLHLQCHFGMDTLSWARAGARVTGVDFSGPAIEQARALATELAIEARFLQANIYDLPDILDETFDVVFTSHGALCWLPDIAAWARVAARFIAPGGFLYIAETHPMLNTLPIAEPAEPDDRRAKYSYFDSAQRTWDEPGGTYAAPDAVLANSTSIEYQHTLGAIVTAIAEAGLRIVFLHEHPFAPWAALRGMTKGDDGFYHLPAGEQTIPLLFSLKATKPG
jgi:SAM-dependent methyltransferase